MRIPLAMLANLARTSSREFAIGWANGLVRWNGRVAVSGTPAGYLVAECSFPKGSTKFAASEAALTFMREKAA